MSNPEPSRRPYLLRAMYEWIGDSGYSSHIVVDALAKGVVVPAENIENEKIVLNIDGNAVRNLSLGNEIVEFDARFQGKNWHVSLPVSAVQGIYAKETGIGMIFSDDEDPGPPKPDTPDQPRTDSRPTLKIVR